LCSSGCISSGGDSFSGTGIDEIARSSVAIAASELSSGKLLISGSFASERMASLTKSMAASIIPSRVSSFLYPIFPSC